MLPNVSFPATPRPPNTSNSTDLTLNQLLSEAPATNHEPLKNKYADHALVMFDNNRTADKNIVAAWAAFMNLGRKGDAEKLRQIGITTFGEKDFEAAISAAIARGTGNPPVEEAIAAAGFARIEVATDLQASSGDDRDTAKKCLATAAQALEDMRKQGVVDKIEDVFKNAFGKDLAEYKEEQNA